MKKTALRLLALSTLLSASFGLGMQAPDISPETEDEITKITGTLLAAVVSRDTSTIENSIRKLTNLIVPGHNALRARIEQTIQLARQAHTASNAAQRTQALKNFMQKNHRNGECYICAATKLLSVLSCDHHYCSDCLTNLLQVAIKDKNTKPLICPDPTCKKEISQADIQLILQDKNLLDQLDSIQLQQWVAAHANHIKHCPTPNCSGTFLVETGERLTIHCEQCNKNFCSQCRLNHIRTTTCTQAKANARVVSSTAEAEQATQEWEQNNTKECPRCRARIEKNEGCNHMTCTNCRHEFCWLCRENWWIDARRTDWHRRCSAAPEGVEPQYYNVQNRTIQVLTIDRAHRLFIRDPHGTAQEMRPYIIIPENFMKQFDNLPCAQREQWAQVMEEYSGYAGTYGELLALWQEILDAIVHPRAHRFALRLSNITPNQSGFIYTINFNVSGLGRFRGMRAHTMLRNQLNLLLQERINQQYQALGIHAYENDQSLVAHIYVSHASAGLEIHTNLDQSIIQTVLNQLNQQQFLI